MDDMTASAFDQRRRGRELYRGDADGERYFIDQLGQKIYDSSNGAAVDPNWPKLDEAAFYGLPGKVVRTLKPHTESDPAALLATFLVTFGAAVNCAPHALADGAEHPARLFVVIVGRTSRARKGSAWQNVRRVMKAADPVFVDSCITGGIASGEGIVAAVGDGHTDKEGNVVDAVTDKRALFLESEFTRVLKVCLRETSTASHLLRDAWDRGDLRVTTRHQPLRATGAHVCLLGHATGEELRRCLTETDAASGYGNRHLFVAARRSQRLPSGGNLDDEDVYDLGQKVRTALEKARGVQRLRRSPDADLLWDDIYQSLDDDADGMVGALTARAEAQLLRLSVIFALTDGSKVIEVDHLRAALAVWSYCEDTVRYVFGDSLGDEVADRLLAAIRRAGPAGLTYAEQSGAFGRHQKAQRLALAREGLLERELIIEDRRRTDGRDAVVNVAVESAKEAKKAKEGSRD